MRFSRFNPDDRCCSSAAWFSFDSTHRGVFGVPLAHCAGSANHHGSVDAVLHGSRGRHHLANLHQREHFSVLLFGCTLLYISRGDDCLFWSVCLTQRAAYSWHPFSCWSLSCALVNRFQATECHLHFRPLSTHRTNRNKTKPYN